MGCEEWKWIERKKRNSVPERYIFSIRKLHFSLLSFFPVCIDLVEWKRSVWYRLAGYDSLSGSYITCSYAKKIFFCGSMRKSFFSVFLSDESMDEMLMGEHNAAAVSTPMRWLSPFLPFWDPVSRDTFLCFLCWGAGASISGISIEMSIYCPTHWHLRYREGRPWQTFKDVWTTFYVLLLSCIGVFVYFSLHI